MCVYIVLQSFQDVTANSFQAQTKATSDSTGLNLLNFMTIQRVARRKPYTDCEVRWWRAADFHCFAATGPEHLKSQLLLMEANLRPSVQQTDQQQQENCCKQQIYNRKAGKRKESKCCRGTAQSRPQPDSNAVAGP